MGLVLKLLASEQRREASGRAALQQQPAPGPRPSASAPCCPEDLRAQLRADGLRAPPVDLSLRPTASLLRPRICADGLHRSGDGGRQRRRCHLLGLWEQPI